MCQVWFCCYFAGKLIFKYLIPKGTFWSRWVSVAFPVDRWDMEPSRSVAWRVDGTHQNHTWNTTKKYYFGYQKIYPPRNLPLPFSSWWVFSQPVWKTCQNRQIGSSRPPPPKSTPLQASPWENLHAGERFHGGDIIQGTLQGGSFRGFFASKFSMQHLHQVWSPPKKNW